MFPGGARVRALGLRQTTGTLVLCFLMLLSAGARADVFNPAYLQMLELSDTKFSVSWRVPVRGDRRLGVQPVFSGDVQPVGPRRSMQVGNYLQQTWTMSAPEGIAGTAITFEGLLGGVTDVIARVEYLGGYEQVERLSPDKDRFLVRAPAAAASVAGTYFFLGMEHILIGIDHLLFVLALLLIVRGWRQIVATVTAFTLAHSITLAAAALGWLSVPIAPVEAIIALSIVFVAAEALHGLQGKPGLTARMPWVVAFSFGLLHGLGFASALSEIGLPEHAITLALLTFNLGVEAGQLVFVAVILLLAAALSFVNLPKQHAAWTRALPYAIGTVAAYWTVERVLTGVLGLPLL